MTVLINEVNASVYGPHQYSALSSDIGVSVVDWPPRNLPTDLGNKLDFRFQSVDGPVARYIQFYGCVTLTLFND